jgi:hypothetical protein
MDADRRFELACRLMFWFFLAIVAFGIALVFFDNRAVPGPLHGAINTSIWGTEELPENVVLYHRFVHAVLGATIACWALALAFVVRNALAARQPWAWYCVCASTLVWFVPDTTASLYFGVWPNALFNVACLASIAALLALTWSGVRRLA